MRTHLSATHSLIHSFTHSHQVLCFLEHPSNITEAIITGTLHTPLDGDVHAVAEFLACNEATFENLRMFRYEQLLAFVKYVLLLLQGEALIPKSHAKLLLGAMVDVTFKEINPRLSNPLDLQNCDMRAERVLFIQAHLVTLPKPHYEVLRHLMGVLVNISYEADPRIVMDMLSACLFKGSRSKLQWWKREDWTLSAEGQNAKRELIVFLVDNFTKIFGSAGNGDTKLRQLYESKTDECHRLQLSSRQTVSRASYFEDRLQNFQHRTSSVLYNQRIVRRAFWAWRTYTQSIESGAQGRSDKMAELVNALLHERRRVAELEVEVKGNHQHMELCRFDQRIHTQLQMLRAQPLGAKGCALESRVAEDLRQIHDLKVSDAT
jgi:hypothetical protein